MYNLDTIVEKCLKPISEENPVGEDIKHDILFDKIKDEYEKFEINWAAIINDCEEILSTKSKDINIAGYLAIGLLKKEGYKGLMLSLLIYDGIINDFGDDYYPTNKNQKRKNNVRKNFFNWFNEEISSFVKEKAPDKKDAEYIINIFKLINNIKEAASKYVKPPPKFASFINEISQHKKTIEPFLEKHPTTQKDVSEQEEEAKTQKKNLPPEPHADIEEKKIHSDTVDKSDQKQIFTEKDIIEKPFEVLSKIALKLRNKDKSNPLSYKLMRIAKWGNIKKEPANNTMVLHRNTKIIDDFSNLFKSSPPLDLIEKCEIAFKDYGQFWFDLQRYIVLSMEKLGNIEAANIIKNEIALLIERFPNIYNLSFKNNIPFADSETIAWLEDTIISSEAEEKTSINDMIDNESIKSDLDEVEKFITNKEVDKALAILQKCVFKTNNNIKQKFILRHKAAEICLKNNRITESRIILEDLYCKSKKYFLMEWEPSIFLNICTNLNKVYQREKKVVDTNKINELLNDILKLKLDYRIENIS